ncbi:MAG TPA: MM0924 family protein [Pyrinomonadaceae bacterium]|nr:MM0924 family protein [Pyrinomonadaceae bacterium]
MPVLHGEIMQSLLAKMIGKKLDVYCGGASSLRGEVIKVEDGVLHLKDSDDKTCYVAVDKILVVWEAKDDEHKAGFVA